MKSIHITFSDHHIPTFIDTCIDDKAEWTQIVGGRWHTVALTKDGKVFTWGDNKVESLDGQFIVTIACGNYHTAAITDKGDTYTWYVSRRIP